ncbi:hypothetical protein CNR22_06610 [Sphingobacteriaceae bacterium]|nr:hypothetical protein CNR22_06610 [Sphingobacteriaceae bacterium]
MFQLTEKHIDHILNDISARGVEMESLQQNLVDHVCCIIEQNLEENGDFESFYQKTIKTFYKDALWEIEEETISLLIFKNYYTMKKIMIWSGALSVLTLAVGIIFKYMYWPGATILICSGIFLGSLLFLPLLFTLKAKEKQKTKDKLIIAIGALGIILVSLSFLSKVMHWPHSIDMMYLSATLMLLLFLPLYFFSGIRNPETKLNTVTTSFLVILVYGILFMMVRTPYSAVHTDMVAHQELGIWQEIMLNEIRLSAQNKDSITPTIKDLHKRIDKICVESMTYVFWREPEIDTTAKTHDREFDNSKRLSTDPFVWDDAIQTKLDSLGNLVKNYNLELAKIGSPKLSRIRVTATLLDKTMRSSIITKANVNAQLLQIRMFLLQNTRTLIAMK